MKKFHFAISMSVAIFPLLSIAKASDLQCARSSRDSLSISVEIAANKAKLGDKLPVRLTLRNTGNSLISLPAVMEAEDYWLRFEIIDVKGRRLRFSGPEVNKMFTKNAVSLLPGYFWGVEIEDLSLFYRFPTTGAYSIQAIYGRSPTGHCDMGEHKSPMIKLILN
jgi:hypothetical protein